MAKDQSGNTYVSESQAKGQEHWADKQKAKSNNQADREMDRANRTDQQQLDRLDELLGVGVGAVKERARLQRRMESSANN